MGPHVQVVPCTCRHVHVTNKGKPKIVKTCAAPLTARHCVKRIYTDLAVIDVTPSGMVVRELLGDPITNPYATNLVSGEVLGPGLSSAALGRLQSFQYQHIKNDNDDVVLTGLKDTALALTGFIQFSVTSYELQYTIYTGQTNFISESIHMLQRL